MKNINKLLKKADAGRATMESACGQIASTLQPFFSDEISVDFQPGDGFVVIWENESGKFAPHNIPVGDVISKIKKDRFAFKNDEQ